MIQKRFAENTISLLNKNPLVLGVAVGGSWIKGDMDEFSDLDFNIVTKDKISMMLVKWFRWHKT